MCGEMNVNMVTSKADEKAAGQALWKRSQAKRAHRLVEWRVVHAISDDELQQQNCPKLIHGHACPNIRQPMP